MKFYDRRQELKDLKRLFSQSPDEGRLAVLTGRRRVGKTLLSLEFVKDTRHLYFFTAKKSEALLCAEFLAEIKRMLPDLPFVGEIHTFKDIFLLLLQAAKTEPLTVIMDEFQEFYHINPAVYSDIQKLWDLHKRKSRLNVIVVGSVYSLIHKIFQHSKEPLFNRADRIFMIKPFTIATIGDILKDHKIKDTKALFDFYLFTGGSPKYIDLLVGNKAFSLDQILDFMIAPNSPFLSEGRNLLIEEFGKEYGTYFSILELISVGKIGRSEIESLLGGNAGGYLDRLENDYAIIAKYKPINAKPNSRSQKYKINDHFLNFWFRFIYRHRSAVESENFEYIKEIIKRDYAVYSGKVLEQFYRDLCAESKKFNNIGSYWEKGNENEIDIVAVNDLKQEMLIAEVKINKRKINLEELKRKAQRLTADYPRYKIQWQALSLENAKDFLS
ncbi:MAG: ATP-binding protein [Candidatus Omnitrophica bacterium]|nr:ATP-binding protein [Candidatus Omnitrophota bacterium]